MPRPESKPRPEAAEKRRYRDHYQLAVLVPRRLYNRAMAAGVPHAVLEAAVIAALVTATELAITRPAAPGPAEAGPAGG